MNRHEMLEQLSARTIPWDMVVIGGGATGVGIAVDAATRGLDVALLEREDFGKGTSSRSTKMVHGGVRYLEQGNIPLVMEALKERGILRRNAPHLVHDREFVVPNYSWWEAPFYGVGLKVYDLLAGKYGFGASHLLSRDETLDRLPTIRTDGLKGGVIYHDGQFDDSRLLIHLAMTAADHGATLVNYMGVSGFTRDGNGHVTGVTARDGETGQTYTISARTVVNATGIFADETRRLAGHEETPILAPSQGVHIVLDKSFLPGESAILVPHTRDGRVLFAIPWHGHVLIGTTDTPVNAPAYEPVPEGEEIVFLLTTAARYLTRAPSRRDILSVFTGIRPLVRAPGQGKTSALSRSHVIHVDSSGLITIAGGKWTTYRAMAEDCVDHAITLGQLRDARCRTAELNIHGYRQPSSTDDPLGVYGSDADSLHALADAYPGLAEKLHPALPYIAAEIVWAIHQEMARTIDDVLARRIRALYLNAAAALEMAPRTAQIMADELGKDDDWMSAELARFAMIARNYMPG